MGIVRAYVKHTPFGSADATKIYNFSRILVRRQMEAKTSTAEITFINQFGQFGAVSGTSTSFFREDDEIQIYVSDEEIDESTDLILNMTVKELNYKHEENISIARITGMDRTFQLLNKLYLGGSFKDGDAKKTPDAIQEIVKWVSENDNRDPGIGTDTNIDQTPTKKEGDPSGTATFVNTALALDGKSAYEWIQNLSQDPYTRYTISATEYLSDRNYIFWVDENEEFHWIYPDQTAPTGSNIITVGQGVNTFYQVNLSKSLFDVVNMVIYRAGDDPDGKEIVWYFYDETSKTPELKPVVIPMTDIAKSLQAFEKTQTTFTGEFPSGYPYTTSWGETVNSDSEYTGSVLDYTGFRGRVRQIADGRAAAITAKGGDLKWKGSLQMKGTKAYVPADLIQLTHTPSNIIDQKIRVKGVEHQIGVDGWFTTLTLEEDAKAIVS